MVAKDSKLIVFRFWFPSSSTEFASLGLGHMPRARSVEVVHVRADLFCDDSQSANTSPSNELLGIPRSTGIEREPTESRDLQH